MKTKEKEQMIQEWEYKRRKWYKIYFMLGVGINFLLYYTKPMGFDPSGSIFWGSFYGLGIPMATMLVCVFIHEKIKGI